MTDNEGRQSFYIHILTDGDWWLHLARPDLALVHLMQP